MLEIKNLAVSVDGKPILKGLNLNVGAGEVHAIMGPNGSGKSTLAQVIAGHEDYAVTGGSVRYKGRDLLDLEPEERAREGVFLGFRRHRHPQDLRDTGGDGPHERPGAGAGDRQIVALVIAGGRDELDHDPRGGRLRAGLSRRGLGHRRAACRHRQDGRTRHYR